LAYAPEKNQLEQKHSTAKLLIPTNCIVWGCRCRPGRKRMA